jgi:hypothetical protein
LFVSLLFSFAVSGGVYRDQGDSYTWLRYANVRAHTL